MFLVIRLKGNDKRLLDRKIFAAKGLLNKFQERI
jgi:hypothetical protein